MIVLGGVPLVRMCLKIFCGKMIRSGTKIPLEVTNTTTVIKEIFQPQVKYKALSQASL
jgi:hypothetical protein